MQFDMMYLEAPRAHNDMLRQRQMRVRVHARVHVHKRQISVRVRVRVRVRVHVVIRGTRQTPQPTNGPRGYVAWGRRTARVRKSAQSRHVCT